MPARSSVTGISFMTAEMGAKLLGLLHELVPQAARFVALVNPTSSFAEPVIKDLRESARTLGLQAEVLYAGDEREIEAAFVTLVQKRADALLIAPDPGPTSHVVPASRGALDPCHPRVCRSRRADELRAEPRECVSTDRHLYRPHPQRRETGRPAGSATNKVRAGHQPQDSQGARPERAG